MIFVAIAAGVVLERDCCGAVGCGIVDAGEHEALGDHAGLVDARPPQVLNNPEFLGRFLGDRRELAGSVRSDTALALLVAPRTPRRAS